MRRQKSSAGGGITFRKAARQLQPHRGAATSGGKLELRAASCVAVLHVAKAARGLALFAVDRKSPAVVGDGDAAMLALGASDGFDLHRNAACAGVLRRIGHGLV